MAIALNWECGYLGRQMRCHPLIQGDCTTVLKRPKNFTNGILKYCRVGATLLSYMVESTTSVSLPGNPCSLHLPRAWAGRVIWGSQHNLPLPLRRTALVKTISLNMHQIIIIVILIMANLVECYLSSSVPNALCVLSHLIITIILLRKQDGAE